jgi:hypothetical protein
MRKIVISNEKLKQNCDLLSQVSALQDHSVATMMSSKRISISGYRVVRADRKDGKIGGGVAMFIKSILKFKVKTTCL